MNEIEQYIAETKAKRDRANALLIKQQLHDDKLASKRFNISSYHLTTKRLKRWGINESITYIPPNNLNELINHLRDGLIDGKHLVSDNFLSSCLLLIEQPFIDAKRKLKGKLVVNTKDINTQLKFLKSRLKLIDKIIANECLYDERVISFIDCDLPMQWILKEIRFYLKEVIDRGFKFKRIKVYEPYCNSPSSPFSMLLVQARECLYFNKHSSSMKRADRKDNAKRIRLYNRLPVFTFKGDRLVSIDRYNRKELPYYLQD